MLLSLGLLTSFILLPGAIVSALAAVISVVVPFISNVQVDTWDNPQLVNTN